MPLELFDEMRRIAEPALHRYLSYAVGGGQEQETGVRQPLFHYPAVGRGAVAAHELRFERRYPHAAVAGHLLYDLQSRSMSLTYSTVLAIVPAFALLLAIGRGFGLQDLLEQQLYTNFPAQKQVIGFGLKFVDSYLKEASSGMFVGIGIVFLLWTLISLLSYIESAFNMIWDIKHDRSLYQKVHYFNESCSI